jgi:MoxR-like ATPase
MQQPTASNLGRLPTTPRAPESVAETGIGKSFLEELLLKILYLSGPLTLVEWAQHARLRLAVVEEIFARLRTQQLCTVTGMTRHIHEVTITSLGRSRALELLSLNQYAGPAPVTLDSYARQVRLQGTRSVEIHSSEMERAFAHLVLDSETLTQLGIALNSGSSILLYGPTGSGKTSIAESLPKAFGEEGVWIPFAVEVDGQIITIYDPLLHKSVDHADWGDPRWVLCHRPAVIAGGELNMKMLDLQFNPVTKFYSGPLHMKANNGVLIVDDFGRQRARPEALLNRWVVPLDRRIDFLTLAGGRKIEIPFELLVVFATNLHPTDLADAAFLRRIPAKVKVGSASPQQFREIFLRVCREYDLACEPELIDEIIGIIEDRLKQPLRACYPRDLVNQVCWAARYEGKAPCLDREALTRAMEVYFLPPK